MWFHTYLNLYVYKTLTSLPSTPSFHRFFHRWRRAVTATAVIFTFYYIYSIVWYHVLDKPPAFPGDPVGNKPISYWRQLPLSTMNAVLGMVCINLFAAVYLPGGLAALLQLIRRSAQTPFPSWLVNWMLIRKHMGLIAFWMAFVHMIMSCFIFGKSQFNFPFFMETKVRIFK